MDNRKSRGKQIERKPITERNKPSKPVQKPNKDS